MRKFSNKIVSPHSFNVASSRIKTTYNSAMDTMVPHPKQELTETSGITFLSQKQAADYDVELMSVFSTDQLMELAGLSVASAIVSYYGDERPTHVVVLCGPGNNGGDGLVAARHLVLFGFDNVLAVYPKVTEKSLFLALLKQAEMSGVHISDACPEFMLNLGAESTSTTPTTTLVVDALFGYSFSGSIREPYASIIEKCNMFHRQANLGRSAVRTIAVDIPSGWHVEEGRLGKTGMDPPDALVSLMLPKLGVRGYAGKHYLGGRFVPPSFATKYGLNIPLYTGADCVVDITEIGKRESCSDNTADKPSKY